MNCRYGSVVAAVAICLALLCSYQHGWSKHKAKGSQVFAKLTCEICHPAGGNTLNPNKPLKGAAFAKKYSDDRSLTRIIRHGVKGTAMPAFGKDQLDDDELRELIVYIRSFNQNINKKNASKR